MWVLPHLKPQFCCWTCANHGLSTTNLVWSSGIAYIQYRTSKTYFFVVSLCSVWSCSLGSCWKRQNVSLLRYSGMSKWEENLAQIHSTAHSIWPVNTQGSPKMSRSQPLGSRMSGLSCLPCWYLLLELRQISDVKESPLGSGGIF